MAASKKTLSIVVPVYNEAAALPDFHAQLSKVLENLTEYDYEIIYCDDGSTDATQGTLHGLAQNNEVMRVISLTRNFGKEVATTAGLHAATGAAVITLDGDGQHPVELIPQFVQRWEAGSQVVIGVRDGYQDVSFLKRWGSKLFYRFFKRMTGIRLVPGATDFRLIDKAVQAEFNKLSEHNRMTRGLIDWLGYERTYITFPAQARLHGDASYAFSKLFKLAIDSVISLSSSPLYITAYIGAIVLPVSILLGLAMLGDAAAGDPFHWHITGGAYVLVLVLFLIGILLMSQGIIGLYLSHIHSETQNRPLYVVDQETSIRA